MFALIKKKKNDWHSSIVSLRSSVTPPPKFLGINHHIVPDYSNFAQA